MTAAAQRWSDVHHGIDPDRVPLLRGWLALMWWLARPFVRLRIPPTAITLAGAVLALDATLLAVAHPWAAGLAVLAAVVCDGLDGAVAVLTSRVTRSGAVADAVADRVSDAAFAVIVWRCGAPWWLALLAGVLALGVDGLRRVVRLPAVITAAERPTATVCTVLACASATVSSASWPATVCAGVWAAAGAVGVGQLLRARSRTRR